MPWSLAKKPCPPLAARPNTCSTCDRAMTHAMPIVKPTTIEFGTFATSRPSRVTPMMISTTPARSEHQMRKS